MRILFAGARFDRSELTFCHRMAQQPGVDFHVVCDPSSGLHDVVRNLDCPITDLTFRSRIDLRAIRTVRSILTRADFDIVHAVTNRALSNSLLAAVGTPTRHIGYRGTIGHVSRFDPASWLTYLNPKVDRIVCVADAVRRYLASVGVPQNRMTTIYKGHDISWYADGAPRSLAEFGIPADAFTVCFAGDMRPVKGGRTLLEAASRLPAPHNIHFIIAGEVHDRWVRNMIDAGRIPAFVHFIGFRRNAFELIGACDALVMPSIAREGLPRAVIEAMAQGIPPIVSNVGGMPELVIHEESGLVVPPRDPEALALAVMRLAAEPAACARLGRAAKQRIEEHFNINATIEQTLHLYRELSAATHRRS